MKGSDFWFCEGTAVSGDLRGSDGNKAYLEELVALLLVLLGHGVGDGLGSKADEAKETEADGETDNDTPSDTGVGTGGVNGAGTVRAEGDPVGY